MNDLALINPKPSTLNPDPSNLNPQPSTLNPKQVSVDDLARCLMDAQQTSRDLRVALTTKEEEVCRCLSPKP